MRHKCRVYGSALAPGDWVWYFECGDCGRSSAVYWNRWRNAIVEAWHHTVRWSVAYGASKYSANGERQAVQSAKSGDGSDYTTDFYD